MKRIITGFLLGPLIIPAFFLFFFLILLISHEDSGLLIIIGAVATGIGYAMTFLVGIPACWFLRRHGLMSLPAILLASFTAGAFLISSGLLSKALFGVENPFGYIVIYIVAALASAAIHWLLERNALMRFRKNVFLSLTAVSLLGPMLLLERHMYFNYVGLVVIFGLFGVMVGYSIWYIGFRESR